MPNNNRLLKSQRPTVEAWARDREGKIVKVRDASCNYRDVFVEWQQSFILDNGEREATIFYQSCLELTPSGKIRREQTEQIRVIYSEVASGTLRERSYWKGCLQLALPIPVAQALPSPPPTIERKHLYPKDKSKLRQKKLKTSQQQTLPLFGAAAKLQAYANRRGELTQSAESLLEGKGIYYSLDGEKIPVSEAILKLIAEYDCSAVEAERIVQLYGVLNRRDLLKIIEQIPLMRQSDGFPDFAEKIKVPQPLQQSQQITVSVSDR